MGKHHVALLWILLIAANSFAQNSTNLQTVFAELCQVNNIQISADEQFKSKTAADNRYLEMSNQNKIIHLRRYINSKNENIFLFNYFVDTSYTNAEIITGCYTKRNEQWVEVGNEILPKLDFYSFYGYNSGPPAKLSEIVQYRYEIRKTEDIKIIIEPKVHNNDAKALRIIDQSKYSAVKLKWNKKQGKFIIKKWLP